MTQPSSSDDILRDIISQLGDSPMTPLEKIREAMREMNGVVTRAGEVESREHWADLLRKIESELIPAEGVLLQELQRVLNQYRILKANTDREIADGGSKTELEQRLESTRQELHSARFELVKRELLQKGEQRTTNSIRDVMHEQTKTISELMGYQAAYEALKPKFEKQEKGLLTLQQDKDALDLVLQSTMEKNQKVEDLEACRRRLEWQVAAYASQIETLKQQGDDWHTQYLDLKAEHERDAECSQISREAVDRLHQINLDAAKQRFKIIQYVLDQTKEDNNALCQTRDQLLEEVVHYRERSTILQDQLNEYKSKANSHEGRQILYDAQKGRLQQLEKEVKVLKAQRSYWNAQKSGLEAQNSVLEAQKNEADIAYSSLATGNRELNKDYNRVIAHSSVSDVTIVDLRAQLRDAREAKEAEMRNLNEAFKAQLAQKDAELQKTKSAQWDRFFGSAQSPAQNLEGQELDGRIKPQIGIHGSNRNPAQSQKDGATTEQSRKKHKAGSRAARHNMAVFGQGLPDRQSEFSFNRPTQLPSSSRPPLNRTDSTYARNKTARKLSNIELSSSESPAFSRSRGQRRGRSTTAEPLEFLNAGELGPVGRGISNTHNQGKRRFMNQETSALLNQGKARPDSRRTLNDLDERDLEAHEMARLGAFLEDEEDSDESIEPHPRKRTRKNGSSEPIHRSIRSHVFDPKEDSDEDEPTDDKKWYFTPEELRDPSYNRAPIPDELFQFLRPHMSRWIEKGLFTRKLADESKRKCLRRFEWSHPSEWKEGMEDFACSTCQKKHHLCVVREGNRARILPRFQTPASKMVGPEAMGFWK